MVVVAPGGSIMVVTVFCCFCFRSCLPLFVLLPERYVQFPSEYLYRVQVSTFWVEAPSQYGRGAAPSSLPIFVLPSIS